MTFEDFLPLAQRSATVADYLDETALEADTGDTDRSVAIGVDLLFGIAAYALYRLAKNYFDHQRGLIEADLNQEMLGQVAKLVEGGWDHKAALDAVMAINKEVATLRPDSPALKAALELLDAGVIK